MRRRSTEPVPWNNAAVTQWLLHAMRICREKNLRFDLAMEEARKQFNQEVANEALTKEMPAK